MITIFESSSFCASEFSVISLVGVALLDEVGVALVDIVLVVVVVVVVAVVAEAVVVVDEGEAVDGITRPVKE